MIPGQALAYGELSALSRTILDGNLRTARLAPLDGLRGLAAVSVVFWHAAIAWPGFIDSDPVPTWAGPIRETPFHALWSGSQAVDLFFLLSGLVLALPFAAGRFEVGSFIVRRICRLYPAYLAALALALIVSATHAMAIPGTSAWFAGVGAQPVTAVAVARQASMVASNNPGAYDPVLWSLVVEMRVSLIFPFLAWAVLRYPWWVTTSIALGLAMADFELGLAIDDMNTSRWIFLFVAGILIAKHRHQLAEAWCRLRPAGRITVLALAMVLYTSHYLWWNPNPTRAAADGLLTGAGCAILVVAAVADDWLGRLLSMRAPQFLGRVSYSLYLTHAIVIVAAVRLLGGAVLPPFIAEGVALVLVLPLAALLYAWIERPGMGAGRWLAGRLARRAASLGGVGTDPLRGRPQDAAVLAHVLEHMGAPADHT